MKKQKKSVYKSMERLGVDYLDLMLLHQPFGDYYGAYHALEDLYEEGVLRAIGVSNFYPDRLADMASFNKIVPHVNQVEVNPFFQQVAAQDNMKDYGVQIEAWAPFAEGKNDLFQNEVLAKIAAKHNRSIAQVIIRCLTARDVVTLAKSSKKERMIENLNSFEFTLDAEDLAAIATLDTGRSLFIQHQTPDAVKMFKEWEHIFNFDK